MMPKKRECQKCGDCMFLIINDGPSYCLNKPLFTRRMINDPACIDSIRGEHIEIFYSTECHDEGRPRE